MFLERFEERDIRYLDRTERRIAAITPRLRWIHAAQIIQDAYNDFKRGMNDDSRQVTLFYHTFHQYQIKPGEPDSTPPCRGRKEKQAQTKLL
ncbi:MAG: hypothetical protein ACXVZU_03980 [Methanobacteriaceae archaeon]